MRKLFGVMVLAAATGVLVPAAAKAQVRVGAQVSLADDADVGIGVRVRGDTPRIIPGTPLSLIGSFDWFFPGGGLDYMEVNGNVAYNFTITGSILRPYAGGGLNFARVGTPVGNNTEIGLNLLGGLGFRTVGRLQPFVELRLEISGGEQFVITGGVHF